MVFTELDKVQYTGSPSILANYVISKTNGWPGKNRKKGFDFKLRET